MRHRTQSRGTQAEGWPLILAIDPGRKPGYVLLDETQRIHRRHLPGHPALPLVVAAGLTCLKILDWWACFGQPEISRIVIEGQFGQISNAKRRSILTLSVEAGWQLHRAVNAISLFQGDVLSSLIHPQALSRTDDPGWRDALGCANATKSVVQNRVEQSLLPAEHALFACASAARLGDCLDATAIGWGAWISEPKDWSPPP